MSREEAIRDFLGRAAWGTARREVLKGDASTRRYERLHGSRGTAILMDQPPGREAPACPPQATPEERRALGYNALARLAAGRVDAFVACATYLKARGLSAPDIYFADPAHGLAVLEDLGDDLYASLVHAGIDEGPLYDAAIDALSLLHREPPPAQLLASDIRWPLLDYDGVALQTAENLFVEWMPRFNPALEFGKTSREDWDGIWAPIERRGASRASIFCHRDYHAENLIWLPRRSGPARVGLLDFQDAVRASPVWDLSMLLHDARRDISPEREALALRRYLDLHPGIDKEELLADFHALGALNIVRILGIFSRLVVRDGKPRYAGFMPRLWKYLDRCLADPGLADLRRWFERNVPHDKRTLLATVAK